MSEIPVEERLAAIVASSDDAILSKDREGRITSWNAGAERLYGYTVGEAIGQPISILIPPHRQGEEREILDKILAGQRVDHYETERVRKDGRMLVISLVVSPLHADGEIIGASVIARDVTERRRAEERAARLQRVTTELSRVAVGSGETVDVVLREAVPAVGGDAGAVGLLEKDGKTIRVAGYRGYSDASLAQWETFPLEADTPMSEAIRNDQPFWSTDTEELKRRYPALAEAEIDFSSLAVIPLAVEAEAFGALAVSFKEPHRFEPDERAFLFAAVQQTAYALERARLYAAERRARDNLAFLARASTLLGETLDVEKTLDQLAHLAVPRIADWCSIDLVGAGDAINNVAVAHVDPAKVEMAREWGERNPPDPDAPTGTPAVIRTGQSELYPEISDELLVEVSQDEEALRFAREVGMASAIIAPLKTHDRVLGAITLITAESGHHYTDDDLSVAEDLARRAAVAIENSLLYREEHTAAVTLQRSLLPRELPSLPGVSLAARYLPAEQAIEVGGDWYDTMELGDGRLALVIGDVAGRGLRAASTMGQLRNALRAYAMDGHTPPEAVERLNRLVRKFENPDMATLVYLAFDLRDRKAECVRAGHPPPLLRRPDGSVSELGVQGSPPIGVGAATYESSHWEIEPGSVVLLYTDGLVERRATGIEPGIKRLKQALSSAAGDVEAVLDHVLVELAPEGVQDDVALLAMSAESSRGGPFQLTVSADPASLVAIRRSFEAWLADQDLARPVAYEVVAACHEACANSCEHAYPPSVEGMMDIQSRIEDGRLELAVRDHGRWREPRNHDRGRGLVLMRHFMEHVDVDSGQDGTTVRMSRPVRTGEPA